MSNFDNHNDSHFHKEERVAAAADTNIASTQRLKYLSQ